MNFRFAQGHRSKIRSSVDSGRVTPSSTIPPFSL